MFDPFRTFDERGYLENTNGDKYAEDIKKAEHFVFLANLPAAIDFVSSRRRITFEDFCKVHEILFRDYYPWAGVDRSINLPNTIIKKTDAVVFCEAGMVRRAIEEGLRLGHTVAKMREAPGVVMGFFAYGHPFLDGNGRAMMVVHAELCRRAGFSIDWLSTQKDTYLRALTAEIQQPNQGNLDGYLKAFIASAQSQEQWNEIVPNISGLDGRHLQTSIEGDVNDPAVYEKYLEFERTRGYYLIEEQIQDKSDSESSSLFR